MDALTLLKQDHKTVARLIDQVPDCEPGDTRLMHLASEIEKALTVHAAIEEKHFYPELRRRSEESEDTVDVFEAYTEHDVMKHLIALLESGRKPDEAFKAELQVLGESVKHHVKEEESTIFSLAHELFDRGELDELGEKMERSKQRLMKDASTNGNGSATPRSVSATRGARRPGLRSPSR
ncbi:MAG: hemerythrin domain-containing protein [Candidatus Tyrphobacter sp.]